MRSPRVSWNIRQNWTDIKKGTKLTIAETEMDVLARLAEAEVELETAPVFHHAGCLDIVGQHSKALDRKITQPNTIVDANVSSKRSVRVLTSNLVCVSKDIVSCRDFTRSKAVSRRFRSLRMVRP
jgi:hypothetical protein